jgi:hypothetical protein
MAIPKLEAVTQAIFPAAFGRDGARDSQAARQFTTVMDV